MNKRKTVAIRPDLHQALKLIAVGGEKLYELADKAIEIYLKSRSEK